MKLTTPQLHRSGAHTFKLARGGPLPVTPRLVERAAPESLFVALRLQLPEVPFPLWGATPQTPTVRASSDPAYLLWRSTSAGLLRSGSQGPHSAHESASEPAHPSLSVGDPRSAPAIPSAPASPRSGPANAPLSAQVREFAGLRSRVRCSALVPRVCARESRSRPVSSPVWGSRGRRSDNSAR